MYNIIQDNFTEIWAVRDIYVYFFLWANQKAKYFITALFFQIFIETSVCDYCVGYDEYLGRIYQNEKFLTLAHILASN